MNHREINKNVMDNTLELCNNLNALKKSIENSISQEYVLYQEAAIDIPKQDNSKEMKITVSRERTFEAASKYTGKKICCLDFANNHHIGGSPWSSNAQEESICRVSTLYPCLYAQKKDFYEKHGADYDLHKIDYMGNDDLIFIPNVTVFKTDMPVPRLMPEDSWFSADVIVSAAPQLFSAEQVSQEELRKVLSSRIKRILDVAAKEKEEVLILGAFGCGAFHNPPELVADIFSKLIRNYSFETVEFAVFCRDDDTNFRCFNEKLSKN